LRYSIAVLKTSGLSLNRPRAWLHRSHSNPRIFRELWQWSMTSHLSGACLQMLHTPLAPSNIFSNSSISILYCFALCWNQFLLAVDRFQFISCFSGLFVCQALTLAMLHILHMPCLPSFELVRLWKSDRGLDCLHKKHVFINTSYH